MRRLIPDEIVCPRCDELNPYFAARCSECGRRLIVRPEREWNNRRANLGSWKRRHGDAA